MQYEPEEGALADILQYLLDTCELTPVQIAVANEIVEHGSASLSAAQEIFLDSILREYCPDMCDRCTGPIPMTEMLDAMETGMCGWCTQMMNKND